MSEPRLSAYGYLFRARAGGFDLDGWMANLVSFFDEVSVATLTPRYQDDDTLERLLAWSKDVTPRVKVTQVDLDININNRFDGVMKTAALDSCSPNTIRVIMDGDERVCLSNKSAWIPYAAGLHDIQYADGLLLPVLDLYSSMDTIRSDRQIGVKFRMHRDTVVRRGVPAFAERGNGFLDTSLSDTTEALTSDGSLARFWPVYRGDDWLKPENAAALVGVPYVLHLGFLDLHRRADLGATFWKTHWEKRSGKPENVATTVAELETRNLIPHGLPLV